MRAQAWFDECCIRNAAISAQETDAADKAIVSSLVRKRLPFFKLGALASEAIVGGDILSGDNHGPNILEQKVLVHISLVLGYGALSLINFHQLEYFSARFTVELVGKAPHTAQKSCVMFRVI